MQRAERRAELLDTAGVGTLVLECQEGRVLSCSLGAAQVLGCRQDQLEGRELSSLAHGDDARLFLVGTRQRS